MSADPALSTWPSPPNLRVTRDRGKALDVVSLSVEGTQDGIRFGNAKWSDGASTSFFYDKLNDVVRLYGWYAGDSVAREITKRAAHRLPSLRQALAEDPRA